jgi:hypothetical protein
MWPWPASGSKRGIARGRRPKLCCSPERRSVGNAADVWVIVPATFGTRAPLRWQE